MSLGQQAYVELYGKEPDREIEVKYHGRITGYNATVRKTARTVTFRLSRKFEDMEPEIQVGVMQFLLNKLNKTKHHSDKIDMYHGFLKKMSDLAPVTMSDPVLEASFQRVNDIYFAGILSQPNLVWGRQSTTLLGTYTYATDTILISQVLRDDEHLLDYVMHHEMLHKKHKFNHSSSRTHSHTKEFRTDEAKFDDPRAEEKLRVFLRTRRSEAPRKVRRPVRRSIVQRLLGWA